MKDFPPQPLYLVVQFLTAPQYEVVVHNCSPGTHRLLDASSVDIHQSFTSAMLKLKAHRRASRLIDVGSPRRSQKGLKFTRCFSQAAIAPFDEIEWETRTAEITDDTGKIIFKQENVEVPKSWSPLATKIAVSKYFYGDIANGNDPYKGGRERSVRQLVHRVTRTIADCGIADGYFADKQSAEVFYQELTWLCVNQYGAFNSPVWFNVGLWHQYHVGKGRGEGNYYYDRKAKAARRAPTQYEYPQGSACFIQSVNDDMEDIMRLATSEAMLFKYGSGTGSDLSSLRSTREKLSGGRQAEWTVVLSQDL
jgi:ribonucleoside-diphosphate reductase alpha chain